MKYFFSTLMIAGLICMGFSGCDANSKNGSSAEETINKDASYALGMMLGANFQADNIVFNRDEFSKGIKDVLANSARYSMEEAQMIFQQAFNELAEERAAPYRLAENEYLAENSTKPGVIVTSSGLQYEVMEEGTGEKPDVNDMVRVHYEGTLTDGTVFDSSYYRGEPAQFRLFEVIRGWVEGIQLMSVGSRYRLYVPSNLGYGPRGAPPEIPPYATLIFEVELLEVIHDH